jgi:hypothetical protein
MKNILFVALLAGASAVQAAPVSPAVAVSTALTASLAPSQTTPMSKEDMKRQRKLRKQNGPEVYKGTVAEQRRIVTDAPGAEKEDGDDASPKKERKMKKNK